MLVNQLEVVLEGLVEEGEGVLPLLQRFSVIVLAMNFIKTILVYLYVEALKVGSEINVLSGFFCVVNMILIFSTFSKI